MNEILKQRIVGAAVITALAAIFVPMLFDDPVVTSDNGVYEIALPEEPADKMQNILDSIPKTRSEVLSQPRPAVVDLQTKKIQQATQEKNLKSWIIQVGSFSKEKNALEFRDKLRNNNFAAYVDSATNSKQGTLYRLRVGPELDEKSDKASTTTRSAL